jgi:membrane-associated phospholipid phosphatase
MIPESFMDTSTFRLAGLCTAALIAIASVVQASDNPTPPRPRPEVWLFKSAADAEAPLLPAAASEVGEVRAMMSRRSAADVERIRWWDVGGPAYRWNEIAVEEMLNEFITTLPATRALALLHTAIDDAVAVAWAAKQTVKRPRPSQVDPSIATAIPLPETSSYPSDYAAAAAAAAEVLGYVLPDRAGTFAAKAEEAVRTRLLAGLEYPSDAAAGRVIGRKAAALAIARGKSDGTDRKWTGSLPQGPGKWQGPDPIAPLAGTWRPWVLNRADEFPPPAPPAFDSEQVRAAVGELKTFKRTPASNHRAIYWELFGGARAYALWNEMARMKLLEYGAAFDAPASARVLAALNVAYLDAVIACFDAKYAYWYIRPSQLDPELKPVFAPPNHPSYPAAHGCLSAAAATVLATLFPRDSERLLALAKEAGESRIWAGVHYRFDVEQGQALGRKVADKVLARAFVDGGQ